MVVLVVFYWLQCGQQVGSYVGDDDQEAGESITRFHDSMWHCDYRAKEPVISFRINSRLFPSLVDKFRFFFEFFSSGFPRLHHEQDDGIGDQGGWNCKDDATHCKRQADIKEIIPLEDFRWSEIPPSQSRREMVGMTQDPKSQLKLVAKNQRPDGE